MIPKHNEDILIEVHNQLLTENVSSLATDLENEKFSIHYYSILNKLERELATNIISLTTDEYDLFIKNKEFLYQMKDLLLKEDLESTLNKFTESFILGAITFFIRENEASVDNYETYKFLLVKFNSWKDIGFSSEVFQKSWEEVETGLKELEGWTNQKVEKYFPILDQLFSKGQISKKNVIVHFRKDLTDREIFYIISSVLDTNPLLNIKFNKLIEDNNESSFLDWEKLLIECLIFLSKKTVDKDTKQFIELYLQNPKYKKFHKKN